MLDVLLARPHDLQGAVDVLGDLDGASAVRFRSPASVLMTVPCLWRDRARADSAPEHGLCQQAELEFSHTPSRRPLSFLEITRVYFSGGG